MVHSILIYSIIEKTIKNSEFNKTSIVIILKLFDEKFSDYKNGMYFLEI